MYRLMKRHPKKSVARIILLFVLAGLGARVGYENLTAPYATASLIAPPSSTRSGMVALTPVPTAIPFTINLSLGANIPASVRAAIEHTLQSQNVKMVGADDKAELVIASEAATGALTLTERIYVAVAWFPTLRDELTLANLRDLWQGKAAAGLATLYVSDETAGALSSLFGPPAATVKRVKPDELSARLWSDPRAVGLVPFEELNPNLTALKLDGMNLLSRDFKLERYPLVVRSWVKGDARQAQSLVAALRPKIPVTNRDPERLTTLIMTGVTALTRLSAYRIEQRRDPAYPARKIAPVLSRADITHVSNEVSFVDDCQPNIKPNAMSFCSKPSYMEALKLIGTDIVGLTGNHLLDFGPQNFLKTLELYDQLGLRYYGGGRNASEAAKPLILSDHGNRLAFLGANSFGPPADWATANRPGAQLYSASMMAAQIASARKQADVVLVELQADETYEYQPNWNNVRLFRRTLADGADIVTGVQAHQPQAVEFSPDGKQIILYGLGNLFFDQMFNASVRQGLIARHTIYQGRLIQTELLTTMLDDGVQPRFATPAERERILRAVFAASGFKLP